MKQNNEPRTLSMFYFQSAISSILILLYKYIGLATTFGIHFGDDHFPHYFGKFTYPIQMIRMDNLIVHGVIVVWAAKIKDE